MLLLCSVSVVEWPPNWDTKAITSVTLRIYFESLSIVRDIFSFFSVRGGGRGCNRRMWDLIKLVPDYCLSFQFSNKCVDYASY